MRIHILGASGSGTSTLGSALASRIGAPHVDVDDYYWLPTDPPYQTPRSIEERSALLGAELQRARSWVLSGSMCGWGDPLIPLFDLVLFLLVPTPARIARLRSREYARYGEAILDTGSPLHMMHEKFIEWAARYDEGDESMRSRRMHEEWIGSLPCKVIRLEGEMPIKLMLETVERGMDGLD